MKWISEGNVNIKYLTQIEILKYIPQIALPFLMFVGPEVNNKHKFVTDLFIFSSYIIDSDYFGIY